MFSQPPAPVSQFTSPGFELSVGSYLKPKPGGRAGPIASTGGSAGLGLQPEEHCDVCAQCNSGGGGGVYYPAAKGPTQFIGAVSSRVSFSAVFTIGVVRANT